MYLRQPDRRASPIHLRKFDDVLEPREIQSSLPSAPASIGKWKLSAPERKQKPFHHLPYGLEGLSRAPKIYAHISSEIHIKCECRCPLSFFEQFLLPFRSLQSFHQAGHSQPV